MENLKNSLRQAASTSSADWQLLEAQCAASSCTVREKAQLCVDTLTAHELAALTASVLRNTVQQQQQQQPQQQPLSAERAALLCVLFSCYLTGSGEPVFALRNCLLETSCVASLALFYIHAAPSATQGQQQQQQQPQNEAWINALELLTLLLFSPATLHHLYELLSAAGWEALLRKVGEDMAAGALDTGDLGQRRAKAGLSWVHALQYAIGKMRASKWQDKVVSRGGAIASLLRAAVQLPNGRRADAFDYLLQRGQARPSILQFAMLVVDEATAIELLGAERLQAGFSYVLLGLADDLRSRRDPNTLQRSIYALVNNLSQKPALADILLRTRVPLSGAGLRGTVSAFDVLWALRTIGGGGPHGEACLDVLAQRFFCHHDHKLINVAARAHFSTARAGGSADEARRLLPAHYIVALADLVRILQGEVPPKERLDTLCATLENPWRLAEGGRGRRSGRGVSAQLWQFQQACRHYQPPLPGGDPALRLEAARRALDGLPDLTDTGAVIVPRRCANPRCERRSSVDHYYTCSRCRSVRYCGPDCQRQDYPRHKSACLERQQRGGVSK